MIILTATMKCKVHAKVFCHGRRSSAYMGGNYPCSTPGFRLVLAFLTRIQPYEISFRSTGIAWCKTILQCHMSVSALYKILLGITPYNRKRDARWYTYFLIKLNPHTNNTLYLINLQLILVDKTMLNMNAISLVSDQRCATINQSIIGYKAWISNCIIMEKLGVIIRQCPKFNDCLHEPLLKLRLGCVITFYQTTDAPWNLSYKTQQMPKLKFF